MVAVGARRRDRERSDRSGSADDRLPTDPGPAPTRQRWWVAAPVLAIVAVFWEGISGRRLTAPSDGHTYYLPLQVLVADQWRQGALPAWDPGTFAGSPLFGTHQSAALDPATLLRIALPPVLGHNLSIVLALVVAACGAFALTYRFTGDGPGAAVAGCAFGLCGFQFAHLAHDAVLATTAWLPWMLWAADRLVTRWSVKNLAVGGAVVAVAALAGHGQMLAYAGAASLGFVIVGAARRRVRALARALAMLCTGAALAAVQLVPVAAALGRSDRSGMSYTQATAWSHDPGSLLLSVFPFLFGNARAEGPVQTGYRGPWTMTELASYVGAAALVLAVVGASSARRDRRLIALAAVGAASLLVALGDSTPLGHVVYALPVFGEMRSWARYTVGAQLAVAVLAGAGVARARRGEVSTRSVWLVGGVASVAAFAAAYPGLAAERVVGSELWWAIGAPCVAAALAVALVALVRRHPKAAVGLVLVVAIDAVAGFGWWFRWRSASPSPQRAVELVEGRVQPPWGEVPDAPGGVDRYLWAGDPLAALPHTPRMAAASGSSSVTGMDPLAPSDYLDVTGTDYWGGLIDPSRLLGRRSHLLDLLRVTVVARPSGTAVDRRTRRPTLPEAFLVGRTRRVPRSEASAAARGDRPLAPAAEAVVEGRCDQCPSSAMPGRVGSVSDVVREGSHARVVVNADRPALLVISEAWAPGWTAAADGRPVPVLRTDGVVQGVPVPAGRSVVELRYRPPGLGLGMGITGVAVALLVCGSAIERLRHRQPANSSRASSADGESSKPNQIGNSQTAMPAAATAMTAGTASQPRWRLARSTTLNVRARATKGTTGVR